VSADGGPVGVLVMAHGTPSRPEDIEAFYTAIRRGRPPTPELLAELVSRYEALGGVSPLAERTRAQVDGLAAALEARAPGRFVVRYGAKYTSPTIEEGMAALEAEGIGTVVGLVLTPHQSSLGSGEYLNRATVAAGAATRFVPVPSWYRAAGFPELLSARTADVLDRLAPAAGAGGTALFFTAHSLPLRVVAEGDPYPDQVRRSGEDVAALLGLDTRPGVRWDVAWQSAGRTADPWIGPDLLEEIRRVAGEGAGAVAVCAVGFVSDHLEVLYDLDIEAAAVAASVGVAFARTPSLNDDPAFLGVLAGVVAEAVS
jgi:ferrochelatase